jgi:hypothetical protein
MSTELLDTILLFGIVSVAAIALVGVAWILATRDRDGAGSAEAQDAHPAAETSVQRRADADERAMRRARLNASNDPILAGLGIPDAEPAADLEAGLPGRQQGGNA